MFQGGLRAVVYTDVLQTLVMFLGVLTVVIITCNEVGGVSEVLKIADKGKRIEFFK